MANAEAWNLLITAASDIGVNRSALLTQLRLEGILTIVEEAGRNMLYAQQNLPELLEVA